MRRRRTDRASSVPVARVVAAALVLAAATALATPRIRLGPGAVSSVIYPAQDLRVAVDHALHADEVGLACTDCHALSATSRSTRDNLLPQEAACVRCHGDEARPGGLGSDERRPGCTACHPGSGERVVRSAIPPARLRFSHEEHVGAVGCTRCHSRVPVRGLATADDLPEMRLCLACHDGRRASRRCSSCHLADPDGVLRTDFGEARLLPPEWMQRARHGEGWVDGHASVAVERVRLCAACHREHECLACHDGSVRPRDVHPGDWMAAHAVEARAGEQRCQSCHRGQSFCRTCHLRAGVAQGSPPGRVSGTAEQVHGDPSWARGLRPRHGLEARRVLQTCVSCHSGQDCVSCHAFVSPHPPGFDARCPALVAAGSQACLACHASLEGLCD